MEKNREARMIYSLVQGQVVTAGEAHEVVDINHGAIWQAIDHFKVKKPVDCFSKVNKLFHYFLGKQREQREKRDDK